MEFNHLEHTNIINGKVFNMIQQFYQMDDIKVAIQTLIKELCQFYKIDKTNLIVQNDKLDKFLNIIECDIDGNLKNYIDTYSIHIKHNLHLFHPQESNPYKNELIKLLGKQECLHVKNPVDILPTLKQLGFESTNSIKEMYIHAIIFDGFFGYLSFERTENNENFSEYEIESLQTFCYILKDKIQNLELLKKYENDTLLKNIILENENIPMAVLEKNTYEVLYHNDLYCNLVPNIAIGKIYSDLFPQPNNEPFNLESNQLLNHIEDSERYWMKKTDYFFMGDGKEAFMLYAKDSLDYIKQLDILDVLTKSLSFNGFCEHYKNHVQNSQFNYALCSLDIDKFKYVNSVSGYAVGDEILKKVADVIRNFIIADENFCRINEDKFSIFLLYKEEDDLKSRVKELGQQFEEMRDKYFPETKITIIGGVTLVDKNMDLNLVLDQATVARKSAKGSHKNTFSFYNFNLDVTTKKEIKIEERISQAITNDEFVAYLQPKFKLETKEIYGSEALVRWKTETGMIFPDEFIPLFEKNGFIITLDFIIYEKVMIHIRKCLDHNMKVYPVSLNVSRNHIQDKNFMVKIINLINQYQIPHELLELEVTESVFVEDKALLKEFIDNIKAENLKVSIDDFGTAYSSLHVLKDVNVDVLKIDKGFLDNIQCTGTNQITKDEIVIKNIINMAKELNFQVICEGVETDEQIDLLRNIGCEFGQGYVFAKPMPIPDFEQQFLLS